MQQQQPPAQPQQPAAAALPQGGPAAAAGQQQQNPRQQPPPPPPPLPPQGFPFQPQRPGYQNYSQFYDDPATEHWTTNLGQVYQRYDVGGGLTPQALRNHIYTAGNSNHAVSVLVHIRDPAAQPDDPGEIMLCHRLTRYEDGNMGLVPLPFPNVGHGFLGDVRNNGQAPFSVELPDATFSRINANTQVPDFGLMEQILHGDPTITMVGPFPAGTADVSPVDSRQAMMVPNWIGRMFLHQGMTPREAYHAVYGAVQTVGREADCSPLLDWLRLTLTRPAANQPPRTAIPPLSPPVLATQKAISTFQDYRLNHMLHDLPGLAPGAILQLTQVAQQGLAMLAHEQRLTRQDQVQAREQKSARKKPSSYYQNDLDALLRLVQVASEDDLPDIHEQLANHTKTQTQRVILQRAIQANMVGRQMIGEDFPVTTAMAQKVQMVAYGSPDDTDFTLGLHIFNMGAQNTSAVSEQDRINRQADILYGHSVAPSLDEVAELTNSTKDVLIPRDSDQLRSALDRTLVFYETVFGELHPLVRSIEAFIRAVATQSRRIKDLLASSGQGHLLPIYAPKIARWFQVEMNTWIMEQRISLVAIPAPDFTQVFRMIRTYNPMWNRPFPSAYLLEYSPVGYGTSGASVTPSTYSGVTQPTLAYSPGSSASGTTATGTTNNPPTTSTTPSNARINNTHYDPRFQRFRDQNIKIATLKANLGSRNPPVSLPTNASGSTHCLAYHIKGMCNSICGAKADHRQLTEPETTALIAWCDSHFKIVE
eukprot:scaffold25059_cov215-Cylindrotheca_fusiformis.AAC.1